MSDKPFPQWTPGEAFPDLLGKHWLLHAGDRETALDVVMSPVVSSNVACVGYDPSSRKLFVGFRAGDKLSGVYAYAQVEPAPFFKLIDAESVGKAFHVLKSTIEGKKL